MPKAEKKLLGQLIERIQIGLGHPHVHAGLGLRKLADELYECRFDLKILLVFKLLPNEVSFQMMGSHDEVQKYLRARR